jgi:hypothetical protein
LLSRYGISFIQVAPIKLSPCSIRADPDDAVLPGEHAGPHERPAQHGQESRHESASGVR